MTEPSETEITLQEKGPTFPRNWDYETFKQYLIGLSRGPNFVLPEGEFPYDIELSGDWNKVLNKMRVDTSDDRLERWAGIGYKTNEVNQRAIYLPNFPAVGKYHLIPSDVISQERARMGRQGGLERVIGDIHSHPRRLPRRVPRSLLSFINQPSFSVGDLYNLVHKSTDLYLMGLVDGVDNLFAFRTSESRSEMVDRNLVSRVIFEKHWYENNGWKYLRRENDQCPYAEPTGMFPASSMDLAKKIAQRHHLVLYRGRENGRLTRIPS